MKTKTGTIAIVALLGANFATAAEPSPQKTEYFIRPLAAYVSPTDGDSATAFGFAAGGSFGSRKEHEVSFEWNSARWDKPVTDPDFSATASLKLMPYLLSYRYYFGNEALKARFYIGASAGMSSMDVSINAVTAGETFSGGDRAWGSTLVGTAGVKFRLTEKADLDIGYRYQQINGPTLTIEGESIELDDLKANILYLGVGFRF